MCDQAQKLVLFSRSDCHLCELAQGLLHEAAVQNVQVVDIEDDLQLLARYGERVPVLFNPHSERELGWPFAQSDLQKFLLDHAPVS